MIQSLVSSKKSLLNLIFSSCSAEQNSLTGQNISYLLLKYKKLTLSSLVAEKNSNKSSGIHPYSVEESWKLKLIEEICLIRKDHLELEFDSENLETILDYICTSWTSWTVGMGVDIHHDIRTRLHHHQPISTKYCNY